MLLESVFNCCCCCEESSMSARRLWRQHTEYFNFELNLRQSNGWVQHSRVPNSRFFRLPRYAFLHVVVSQLRLHQCKKQTFFFSLSNKWSRFRVGFPFIYTNRLNETKHSQNRTLWSRIPCQMYSRLDRLLFCSFGATHWNHSINWVRTQQISVVFFFSSFFNERP